MGDVLLASVVSSIGDVLLASVVSSIGDVLLGVSEKDSGTDATGGIILSGSTAADSVDSIVDSESGVQFSLKVRGL